MNSSEIGWYTNFYNHKPTIFIIGTGPSNRVFPLDYLDDSAIKIGLNQAWKTIRCRWNITIHPHCIPFRIAEHEKWFTKEKKSDHTWAEHEKLGNTKKWIYFTNTDDLTAITPDAPSLRNTLFVGRGIQTGGLHLAAHLGARTAVLVGCDMDSLAGDHHTTPQHTQFHNIEPNDVYKEYYFYTAKVRKELKKHYNMDVLTLSPFLGQKYADEDYAYLCQQNNLPKLEVSMEIETAPRKTELVKDYIP